MHSLARRQTPVDSAQVDGLVHVVEIVGEQSSVHRLAKHQARGGSGKIAHEGTTPERNIYIYISQVEGVKRVVMQVS